MLQLLPIGKIKVNILIPSGIGKDFYHMVRKNMDIYEEFLKILDKAIAKSGSANKLAEFIGVNPNLITRWKNKDRVPSLSSIQPILDYMGVQLTTRDTAPTKDICFIDATVVPAGEGHERPDVEDYLAVPLVEEIGAGPGIIPQNQLLSWVLVWRNQKAIAYRRDLIAVQVSKDSTSMVPTINPLDIVLVDRQDRDVLTHSGRIMLVMDPEGAGKIKRVAAERCAAQKDYRVTYYSDNAADNAPEVLSLRDDFFNDWDRTIVGRVVWVWSDVSCK